ncbi:MAG: hypothetical protein JRG95_21555 [Deltaproteobacteria bacterium]|nr:hypothetical protein [Deltaproteobacteria bacterium]
MRIHLVVAVTIALLGTSAIARPKAEAVRDTPGTKAVLAPNGKTLKPIIKPVLSVKSIAKTPVEPGGHFKEGVHVSLDIRVKNTGSADSQGTEQLKIECKVVSGGACPVANSIQMIPAIPKGSDRSVILIAAQTTVAGTYTVTAWPVGGTRGSGAQVTIQVKGNRRIPAAAQPAGGLGGAGEVLKTVRPDLQIEVINPSSAGQPATIRVHNKSGTPTPQGSSFVVMTEIIGSCEAGKLESKIATQGEQQNVGVLAANSHKDLYVKPASGAFGNMGCYYKIKARADTWQQIAELSETNNKGSSSYCPPGGSCY